jgi:hypothetical protein
MGSRITFTGTLDGSSEVAWRSSAARRSARIGSGGSGALAPWVGSPSVIR